jgi:excisionase family DNA binding protein
MSSQKPPSDPDPIVPRLLTVEQVAGAVQTSPRTVRRLIANKKLPVIRIGRLIRIRPEAYAALLDKLTRDDRSGK